MLGETHSGDCKMTGHDSLEHSSAEPSGHSGIPSALIASAALALAGWAAPLRAQTAPDEATDTSALQEIVVTARKREERLIDVPVAVTAVTAATINQYQATNLGEIGNLVPGVSLERTQSGGLRLKNRIVMSPMTRWKSPDQYPSDDVAAYYRRRAENERSRWPTRTSPSAERAAKLTTTRQ